MRYSEYIANQTLAESARIAAGDRVRALQVIHNGQGARSAGLRAKRDARRARMARIAMACAPGGSVGPWLRFAGFAVVVAVAAYFGSVHA